MRKRQGENPFHVLAEEYLGCCCSVTFSSSETEDVTSLFLFHLMVNIILFLSSFLNFPVSRIKKFIVY